jgi:hypothetical protein
MEMFENFSKCVQKTSVSFKYYSLAGTLRGDQFSAMITALDSSENQK